MEGNRRFYSDSLTHTWRVNTERRENLLAGQSPFAAVLGCADSRTPPEHIFDAGLGEVFVVRNAGNLVDPISVGSLEYAVEHTGCPLVCVMGHRHCGAMNATVAAARTPVSSGSPHVDVIIERAMPAVIAARQDRADNPEWADAASLMNVALGCREILRISGIIAKAVGSGSVGLAGLLYDVGTGRLEVIGRYGDIL